MSNYQIITYSDPSSKTSIADIVFYKDTIRMTQEQMGSLYKVDISGISRHIKTIYSDNELKEEETSTSDSNLQKMQNTQNSFKKPKKYYNLQIVIAVGFKVNSPQAVSFRTRANKIIQEYIEHGYAMDDNRLSNGGAFGGKKDFETMMERVRAIRFNEKNLYEKIKELFTTAADYKKDDVLTTEFFQTIQNKFHYAITGMTSPELIYHRASSDKPALGMQSYDRNNIIFSEARVGKNYLLEEELRKLYLLCEQFFSFAELQYAFGRELSMKDRVQYLDDLLKLNKLEILEGKGSMSREKADEFVQQQMIAYQQKRGSLEAYIEGVEYLIHNKDK